MTILVTSLSGQSQTLDSVAIGAYAKQYRAGTVATQSTALANAVAAKTIMTQDVAGPSGGELLNAAATLTKYDNGKTYFLDLAGGFNVTLPAPELGLKFSFVVKTAPTTAYTIVSNASANIIKGTVVTDATGAADTEVTGGDTISFVAATAVAGDRVDLVCDGTSWHMTAVASVATGITITTAS